MARGDAARVPSDFAAPQSRVGWISPYCGQTEGAHTVAESTGQVRSLVIAVEVSRTSSTPLSALRMLSLLVAAGALVASPMRLVSPATSPAVAARTPAAPLMGVTVKTTKPGDGKTYPKAGQMVKAHYTGRLLDGTVFDSSRGFLKQPFQFQIGAGDVIRGWDQGMLKMSKGEKATLTCTPDFACTREHIEPCKRGPPCTRLTHPRRDNACRYLARQTASAARRPTSRPARPWSSTSSSLASAESPSSEPAGQTAGAQPRARRTRTRVVWYIEHTDPFFS